VWHNQLCAEDAANWICVRDRADCLKTEVLLLLLLLRGTVCPDGGGGRHRNMSECRVTVEVFLNGYMCTALGQSVDNNCRDTYIVKFIGTQFRGRRSLPEILSKPQILQHTVTVSPLAGGQGLLNTPPERSHGNTAILPNMTGHEGHWTSLSPRDVLPNRQTDARHLHTTAELILVSRLQHWKLITPSHLLSFISPTLVFRRSKSYPIFLWRPRET
jgi:hypothetical protein